MPSAKRWSSALHTRKTENGRCRLQLRQVHEVAVVWCLLAARRKSFALNTRARLGRWLSIVAGTGQRGSGRSPSSDRHTETLSGKSRASNTRDTQAPADLPVSSGLVGSAGANITPKKNAGVQGQRLFRHQRHRAPEKKKSTQTIPVRAMSQYTSPR